MLRLFLAVILLFSVFQLQASESPVKIKKEIKKGNLRIRSQCRQDLNLTISLFDMQGKLVKQVLVRTNQTSSISEIARGTYFLEIFSKDERIENGSITVP